MVVKRISIKDLPNELRAIPRKDQVALAKAIRQTLGIDAYRWVDWSMRGGGIAAPPSPLASKPKPKQPRAPKAKQQSFLAKLVSLFFKRRSVPRKLLKHGPKKPPQPPKNTGYRVPVDTADYASSWRHEFTDDGGYFYNSPNPPIKAGVIEAGRRPGKGIPTEPLAEWVRRKLGENDPKRARGIAYAISMKHKEEGRPGLWVLKRAHPKIAEALLTNYKRQLKKV